MIIDFEMVTVCVVGVKATLIPIAPSLGCPIAIDVLKRKIPLKSNQ